MVKKAVKNIKNIEFSTTLRQVLVGVLLGDAHIESRVGKGPLTGRLLIEQSERHADYVAHLYDLFKEFINEKPPVAKSRAADHLRVGLITSSIKFRTLTTPKLGIFRKLFYNEKGKKIIPKYIGCLLSARALAYWYMDDGSIKDVQSKAAILNTQGFELKDVEKLCRLLKRKFDLECTPRRQSEKSGRTTYQIYISSRSYENLCTAIDSYLVDTMRYKLPPPRKTRDS